MLMLMLLQLAVAPMIAACRPTGPLADYLAQPDSGLVDCLAEPNSQLAELAV